MYIYYQYNLSLVGLGNNQAFCSAHHFSDVSAKLKIIEKPTTFNTTTTAIEEEASFTTTSRPPSEVKVNPIKKQTTSKLASKKENEDVGLDPIEFSEFSEFVRGRGDGGHRLPLDLRK